MRILFVTPAVGKFSKRYLAPPLGIGILIGLTPDEFEVKFIDCNIDSISFEQKWDVVAISVSTPAAPAAYAIADKFRELGSIIVMGGVHPTVLPQECLKHSDALFIGEGEVTWLEFLDDLKRKKLKKIYKQNDNTPIVLPEIPRHMFKSNKYLVRDTVLVSRGCPNDCEFCVVKKIYGPHYRTRDIDSIIEDINRIEKTKMPIVFVDDNIVGDPNFAKKLFKKLIPLKIRWFSQCSISIVKDEQLLELAAESGCLGLYIGFESIDENNLVSNRKRVNHADNFINEISKIRAKGIIVHGAFIFGFEHDTCDVFERTLKFSAEAKLDSANFGILVPYPGTSLYAKLMSERRIFEFDWSKYDAAHVVFYPKNMTPKELQVGQYQVMKQFYSKKNILSRIKRTPKIMSAILNLSQIGVVKELRKIVEESNFN